MTLTLITLFNYIKRVLFNINDMNSNENQTFHYTRCIRPKRVTSLRCPSPRRSAKATPLILA